MILALFLSLALAGCAVAPLSNHVSARTNGDGQSLLSVGSTIGVGNTGWVPTAKYSIGLSDRFDLGFQYEVVEYGAWGKYQLLGGKEGFALAGLAGIGLGLQGFYGYLGPVVSWKMGIFEPYFVERYNYVDFPSSSAPNVTTIGEIQVKPGSYHYLQHSLGFFLWPIDWVGLGLEASAFTVLKNSFVLDGRDRYLISGQFSFRF